MYQNSALLALSVGNQRLPVDSAAKGMFITQQNADCVFMFAFETIV